MGKLNLSSIARGVRTAMKKHSPEILTGMGIAGMVTTVVMAVRATPKALMLIEEAEDRLVSDFEAYSPHYELTAVEKVKTAWTCYIPSAIVGSVSILCIIGATSVNLRRNAALATAFTLSESALREYQEKVVETIGEKKEQAVREAVARDKIDKNPVRSNEVIITERGNTLCYDAISGRYFKSDMDKLKKAENELNIRLRNEMWISLNEFYYEIGIAGIKVGDGLGWDIDHGAIELWFSSHLTENGEPCLAVDYKVVPQYQA